MYINKSLEYRDVANALRSLKKSLKWPWNWILLSGIGICGAIKLRDHAYYCWVYNKDDAFQEWEHYSGSTTFPIPESTQNKDYVAARRAYHKTTFMFSRFTEYGRLRRKLLDHLIEWFERKGVEESTHEKGDCD